MSGRSPLQVFPFMRLPAELRNMIYGLSFDFSYALRQIKANRDPPYDLDRRNYDWVTTPSILLLNHQVYAEAREILYNKEIVLDGACEPRYFIRCFSKVILQKIQHVTLNIDLSSYASGPYTLHHNYVDLCMLLSLVWGQCHSLRTFRLDLRGAERKIPSPRNTAFYSLRDFRKALFKLLPKLEGITDVAVTESVEWLPRRLSCKKGVVHHLKMYMQTLKGEEPTEEMDCYRGFMKGDCRYDATKFMHWALLGPDLMRWWFPNDNKLRDDGKEGRQLFSTADRLDEFIAHVKKVGLLN
ncbi:hypothetical protein MMC30_004606 [Trapelia coarctata]|nr:hypothetical protein [Trapelia coarctata]